MADYRSDPYCLVLSGGGAKGMYHIGVWRALRDLRVPVNAFIGNSIGAVVSAFLAQGLYEELEEIGDTIGIETVINVPDELIVDGNFRIDRSRLGTFRRFSREVIEHRALDTSPMRRVIYDRIDEDAIRHSGNDLAVVTFNLTDMKPHEVFIDDMEPGTLCEYVLASAAFPGFERPVIEGKKYIDGGVYNNLPYDLALARGYRNIIAVDLAGMGVNRRLTIRGTNTVSIRISAEIGGVLDFNRQTLDRLRTLGYLDTMKAFGQLVGIGYFIEPDAQWEKRFAEYLENRLGTAYRARLRELGVLPHARRHERRLFYPLLDSAATALRLPRIVRYSYEKLCAAILAARTTVDTRVESINGAAERKRFLRTIRLLRSGRRSARELPRSPYYYARLLQSPETGRPASITSRTLHRFYPELIGTLFLFDESLDFLRTVADRQSTQRAGR